MSEQTETFDWMELWRGAYDAWCNAPPHLAFSQAAAAYLRTRIEAAFVPRKQPLHCETCGTDVAEVLCGKCGKWWRDNSPEVHEATAPAEAAEARNKVLEEALSQIRALTTQHRTHVTRAVYRIASEALGAEHGK